jgi:hypothetical protein
MPAQRMEKVVPELALPHINMRGTYRFPVERYADRLVASARSLDKTFALPHDDQPPRHAFRTKTELSKNDFQRICG